MKVPLHIAEKLLLLLEGASVPGSSARHTVIEELIAEGIIERRGRIKKTLQLYNQEALHSYLKNKKSIPDLHLYIETLKKEYLTRSELIAAASDSKIKAARTFKGFLINSYIPIEALVNDKPVIISPVNGMFHFVSDYEKFVIPDDFTIVGIENPESFRYIEKQKQLFIHIKPVFISRYPQSQSGDLMKWLKSVANPYLHFGDFDFAGIGIYINEYKNLLNERANFFVPDDLESLFIKYGNRKSYNVQKLTFDPASVQEENLVKLISLIHKHRKGLEQEILIENCDIVK